MSQQVRRFSRDEFNDLFRNAGPPTPDDVGIVTLDGRHLKTKDEILAFIAEVEESRAAGEADRRP